MMEFAPYQSQYVPTMRPEIAQMLRERYDKNRQETSLVQQMLSSIETRPMDSVFKDEVATKIDDELGSIIESGRYELGSVALMNAQNILQTDKNLLAAQQSYKNRMADLEFLQTKGQEAPVIDWGKGEWESQASMIMDEESGEYVPNVYQSQATTMYDYGKEKRSMLKTISADWSGISPDKAAVIAESLLNTYLSGTNAIGNQEVQYLSQFQYKDVEDQEKREQAIINKLRQDFQNLTLQYVHQKSSETTIGSSKEIKAGLKNFWDEGTIVSANYTNLDASKGKAGDYVKNVLDIFHDFDPGTEIPVGDMKMAINILKVNDITALQNANIPQDQIDQYIDMKYNNTGGFDEFMPLNGLIDYLTTDLGTWKEGQGMLGDKFGPLADKGVGDVGMSGLQTAASTYGGMWALQGLWNMFGGSKVKLAKTIFSYRNYIAAGAGGSSIVYDVASNNLFNQRNNVRDGDGAGMTDAETLTYILNDVDWVNEKLGTNYDANDPNYKQAIVNSLALLEYRKNAGGDNLDQIVDSYGGTAFEGKVWSTNDGGTIGNINSYVNTLSPDDFKLLGTVGQTAWHEILGVSSDKKIKMSFGGIVQPSIQHNIPLTLRLGFEAEGKYGQYIVGDKGSDLQSVAYTIARDAGAKQLIINDLVRIDLNSKLAKGSLNEITPNSIFHSMIRAYKTEAITDDGEAYMTNEMAVTNASSQLRNIFALAHPEIYQQLASSIMQQAEQKQVNLTEVQLDNEIQKLLWITMNDANYWGGVSWMDQKLGN